MTEKEIEPAEIKHPLLYTLHSQTEENCFVLQIIIHRNLPPHVTLPGTDCQYLSCVPSVTPMLTSCQNYLIEILKQNRPSGKNLYEGAKIFYGDEMTKALAGGSLLITGSVSLLLDRASLPSFLCRRIWDFWV